MFKATKLFTTTAVAVTLTLIAVLFVSRSANAQRATTVVVCVDFSSISTTTASGTAKTQEWMNQQHTSGRRQFIAVEHGLCAWP
jgi:hypothetical protein